MTAAKVLVQAEARGVRPLTPSSEFGWRLLGLIGLAFSLIAGADLVLTWYPFNIGSPEWEFGSVTSSLDGLPLLVMGLTLSLAGGVARGQRGVVRTVAMLFLILAVMIVVAALLYVTNVPIALQSVQDPGVRTGLKKAIAKTSVQAVVYPAALLWLAVKSWRHAARS